MKIQPETHLKYIFFSWLVVAKRSDDPMAPSEEAMDLLGLEVEVYVVDAGPGEVGEDGGVSPGGEAGHGAHGAHQGEQEARPH